MSSITDAELLELEMLLEQEKKDCLYDGLTCFDNGVNPNYKLLYDSINSQKWGIDDKGFPKLIEGYSGAVLEGGTRSGKTWAGVDIIIYLTTDKHKDKGCTINIYRETYNEFKTTLYDDFKTRLEDFELDNPFHRAKEVKSFRIGKSTINFMGDGKFGGACDYAFFNEVMFIEEKIFMQVVIRCRNFWWMDFNPCFTDHWVFNKVIPRKDVNYIKTTFKDNPYVSPNALNETLNTEPWESGSYEVQTDVILYKGKPISKENQPPPHKKNIEQGTDDEFFWKVFGLGLRGAMKGVIFDHVTWIDKFPDMGYMYSNDFGFTADPNALVRYAEDDYNIFIEPLVYTPIETPEELATTFEAMGVEIDVPIACDSSDKYTGENKGTVEMVKGIRNLGFDKAFKISKKKSIMYWILTMKKKKIHIVKNHLYKEVKIEKENYKFKEINGIMINQPIDKYNHFWDAARYGHMAWNREVDNFETKGSLGDMGINY
ncbi:terminase large subunit [Cellulophaga phage Nekkels_1]|uniref:Terminase large subunit n=1 Tax=Cellulophaga phage Nekkels_1 TaxID=2745692 RepID=A0A8E4XVJ0_9CAUD|nr:terminase large subunit [Cellulophaga phage Nekkels_1]QQO97024.1 terminase large subunit [Cellulophaga phage Nekkels_1]QQO97117.1 terminase large subunit [Cellulophaga phage Nekkels_2]